jgi:hypothetical protein
MEKASQATTVFQASVDVVYLVVRARLYVILYYIQYEVSRRCILYRIQQAVEKFLLSRMKLLEG